MKLLVLSDSHGCRSFMRRCVEVVQPRAIIHLGDHYDDGQILAEEYPQIPVYQVPGNCDLHRLYCPDSEIRVLEFEKVRLYLTHGHRHGVKRGLFRLLADARAAGAQVVLFGHTHMAVCFDEDGLRVMNPGAASWSGSCGVLELRDGNVIHCSVIQSADL